MCGQTEQSSFCSSNLLSSSLFRQFCTVYNARCIAEDDEALTRLYCERYTIHYGTFCSDPSGIVVNDLLTHNVPLFSTRRASDSILQRLY